MIVKQKSSFVVKNKAGTKTLGKHKTKKAAMKQLAAIELSKRKALTPKKRKKK